ncbi:hypothetical protein MBLNU459_g5027t1 [Dothideomycetes sp. NU459]
MTGPTNCLRISASERAVGLPITNWTNVQFVIYNHAFEAIIGPEPSIDLALEADYPFAHEAGVYFPGTDSIFVTSNRYVPHDSLTARIAINQLKRHPDHSWTREEISTDVVMANGGINYQDGVLFCAQGDQDSRGGLVYMAAQSPHSTETLLDSYLGKAFNSVNDVVVKSDGTIWFTDPIYGSEQGFREKPRLPNQVYRFDRTTGDLRAVADGFGRPNGLCFSPDETTLYITDTDWIHGDGTTDDSRPSTIYAFDVIKRSGADFLANRRLFAMADVPIPDGIKCDTAGNVYSGCGDGLNVWSPGGTLLGKIIVPGGVANFCFGRSGELFLLNEDKFWVARIAKTTSGALLAGMGIEAGTRH